MVAYYNENNPQAAAWLRELINAGAIAPGDVDDRSIEDVTPADLEPYQQCHFFAGIGVWSYALRQSGWADDRPVWTGSCPCQSFSAAGKRKGFDDERHLWPAFFWLIEQCRPTTVFGEQTASAGGLQWLDLVQSDLEGTGYACGAFDLSAAGVGAPHIRQRLYWVADDSLARLARRTQQSAQQECPPAQRGGDAGSLVNPQSPERERQRPQQDGAQSRSADAGVELLADANCSWRGQGTADRGDNLGQAPQRGQSSDRARECSTVSGLGHADRPGGGRNSRSLSAAKAGCDLEGAKAGCIANSLESAGADSILANPNQPFSSDGELQRGRGLVQSAKDQAVGIWDNAEWITCRDGKLRPVERGIFPLVDGAAPDLVRNGDSSTPQTEATSESRTMRLRGYGNAIVAPLAQVFIESCMDVLRERGI